MFLKRVKHHQWLCSAIPLKTQLGQISSDCIRIQGPTKRPSSGRLHPVSAVKERNRRGGKSLGFYSRLFLVPEPHQRWRPVIDLSRLNTFLHVEKLKMETPESIRTSLIPGEWVSLINLSDAYPHIPIHPHSRKYLRFCHRSQVFQFTSLPFGLATAPQVFTMIVKEVKLMALSRGLRLHQYLDWLIRSQSQEEAQLNTQAVVDLTKSLGWIINQEKSELKPTQVFSFVGYKYHLNSALLKPAQKRWLKLQDFILQLKSKHVLTARCLMSPIGLLASMEKMVLEGRLHIRPFQIHLKEHWRYPQLLDSLLKKKKTQKQNKLMSVYTKMSFLYIHSHTQMSIIAVSLSLHSFIPLPSTTDKKKKKLKKNQTYFSQITAIVTIIIVCKVAGCQSLNVLGPNTSCVIQCLGDGQLVSR